MNDLKRYRTLSYVLMAVVVLVALLLFRRCAEEQVPEVQEQPVIVNDVEKEQKIDSLISLPTTTPVSDDSVVSTEKPAKVTKPSAVRSGEPKKETPVVVQVADNETDKDVAKETAPVIVPAVETPSSQDQTQAQDLTQTVQDDKSEEVPAVVEEIDWSKHLYVKTNIIGLAAGVTNLAFEADLAPHWSFQLPMYYCAWNFFDSRTKFRTFTAQPELRYWFSPRNDGFFTGAHFGLSYYNVALGGDYRYQDHNMETPALGGGLSLGYRTPISGGSKWKIEFALGAGGYSISYDRFHNTPDVKEGLMVDSIKSTYWGIDHASISLVYSFNQKKKGGLK